jgi:hypothetical protein
MLHTISSGCNFKWQESAWTRQLVRTINTGYIVTLEEIYEQANSAAPLLHAKAEALSIDSQSAGSQILVLPVMISEAETRHMKGSEATETVGKPPVSERGSSALCVKPWGRAVEKLVRCYGGDPTRLVDCCRQACGCVD